jgi:hypothetical protein
MSAPKESLNISPFARLNVRVRSIMAFVAEHTGKQVEIMTVNSLTYRGKLITFADSLGTDGLTLIEEEDGRALAIFSSDVRKMEVVES